MSIKEEREGKPLWDRLMEHDKKVKKLIDQKFIEKRLHDYEKETEGCTFSPELYTQDFNRQVHDKYQAAGDIYNRNNMWKLQKDMKIDEQRLK